MKSICSVIIAISLAVPATSTAGQFQNSREDVADLCAAVANPLTELRPAFPWVLERFQSKLYKWAGTVEGDTEAAANEKVRIFLNANMQRLLCLQANFNPRNGNLLKLAVARQSNSFIDDVLERWRPDLNQVDITDGRTVLDYIRDRRNGVGPDSSFGRTLGRYYDRFRAAGARHANELPH